jgi:hypothetical protein
MGKRGPQPYAPTKKQRDAVKLYVAGGIAEPVIAHKIGICQMTLRKHFADELNFGRDMKRAENLQRLDDAAEGGNVTAMKHLDGKFELVSAKASFIGEERPRAGKKEIVRAEAMSAGMDGEWEGDLNPPSDARPN